MASLARTSYGRLASVAVTKQPFTLAPASSSLAFLHKATGSKTSENFPSRIVLQRSVVHSVDRGVHRLQVRGKTTEASRISSVPVQVAHELLNAGHHYLDVRTPDEYLAGHIEGAINIPYMYKVGSGMSKNPNFLEAVSSHFDNDDEIVVGCQSGKRSMMATVDLASSGFSAVTDMGGGFGAWVQSGLPVVK